MTSVTLVSQWYPPEPIEIPRNIAISLTLYGHKVSVLTGVPNYPTGEVAVGHRAFERKTEQMDGLVVCRTPLYPSHDSNAIRRIANYASWAVSASILGQRPLRKAGAALVYSSPATAALPAMVARRLWGTPYILLIQDVWPDSIFASGFLPGAVGCVIRAIVNRFVQRSYALADHVVVISPGMGDLLTKRGVAQDKLSVIYNWVPEEDQEELPGPLVLPRESLASQVGVSDATRIFLYAGNHGHAQALDSLVRAFLDDLTAPAHLVMVGEGVAKDHLVTLAGGHPRVHFLDAVDRTAAALLLAEADISVISLADEPLFAVTVPSKVQSGLASAIPMLVIARGDAASVVVDSGAGAAATPGNVDEIIEAVRTLTGATGSELAAMGLRGLDLYQSQMSRAVGAARLSNLLTRAASRRNRRGGRTAAPHPERKRS